MEQLTRNQAQRKLDEWAEMMKDRDPRIVAARDAGLTNVEISSRMGIARSTVEAALRRYKEEQDAQSGE